MIELRKVRVTLDLGIDGRTSRVTVLPNSQPAPRGLTAQVSMSSGSDHMRSAKVNQEEPSAHQ